MYFSQEINWTVPCTWLMATVRTFLSVEPRLAIQVMVVNYTYINCFCPIHQANLYNLDEHFFLLN